MLLKVLIDFQVRFVMSHYRSNSRSGETQRHSTSPKLASGLYILLLKFVDEYEY